MQRQTRSLDRSRADHVSLGFPHHWLSALVKSAVRAI